MKKVALTIVFLCSVLLPQFLHAQEVFRAEVTKVVSEEKTPVELGIGSGFVQMLEASVIFTKERGVETVLVSNDYIPLNVGDRFFLQGDSDAGYVVSEVDRTWVLIVLTILFLLALCIFGGIQGVRGLASLIGSLLLIIFVLVPNLLTGTSPVLVSLIVAALITIVGAYITHGFSWTTSSAIFGMVLTIAITGILSQIFISLAHLSGKTEEGIYLSVSTGGSINLVGILLGGMLIGLLGVLYDAAIGQAVAVEELCRANPNYSKKEMLARSLRIGREHIGALVNTLAIAYVGASLPLLLLLSSAGTHSIGYTLNSELFATEIVRTLVGSIGLVLAIPITTALAVFILYPRRMQFVGTESHGHSH
jgi:uncharacterized membrane protein